MSKHFESEKTKKAQNHVLRAIFLGNEGIILPIFFWKALKLQLIRSKNVWKYSQSINNFIKIFNFSSGTFEFHISEPILIKKL